MTSTRLIVGSAALLAALSAAVAGPNVRFIANSAPRVCAGTPVVRPLCRPVAWWTFSAPALWWGPVVTWTGPSSGFGTVSPFMTFADTTPVVRVPPPVLAAEPVTVFPSTPFRWRN
jgi:hypothetical protein